MRQKRAGDGCYFATYFTMKEYEDIHLAFYNKSTSHLNINRVQEYPKKCKRIHTNT